MKKPDTGRGGFTWLIFTLGLLVCTSSVADPGTDFQSQVESYLDRIRTKVDSIQQSVDAVEDPPLGEKIADAFSFNTCVDLETLLNLSINGGITIPIKLEAKANPGAAVVQGKAEVEGRIAGSGSIGASASLGAGFSVCFDLWKLARALWEETQSSASAMDGLELSMPDTAGSLLDGLSPESQNYLLGLSNLNPADLFNTLLDPAVNETFGLNPDRIAGGAVALWDEVQGGQLIPDPSTMISDVEASLNKFVGVLPLIETVDFNLLMAEPDVLSPCSYIDEIPFELGFDLSYACAGLQSGLVAELSWVVGILDNLLSLADVKATLDSVTSTLSTLKDVTLGQIETLISNLQIKQSTLCDVLDPAVDC